MDSKLLIVLVAAAAVWAGTAVLRHHAIPTPVVLVVAGVVIGFLPFVPDTSLEPHVVLLGFLPLLVFHAAFTGSHREYLSHGIPIFLLATGLVIITAALVAVVAHYLGHISWPMAFVLGTAVGPTDAVAATGIVRRLGLPRRLAIILEGEALFNDGTALVLYGTAVSVAVSGHVSIGHTFASVLYSAAVGTALGLAVAFVGQRVRRLIDDPPMEIVLSLLLAYGAYLPAEALGASGVLAAVTAGLYLGWQSFGTLSARTRLQSTVFWDSLAFLMDGALFILVGLSLHTFAASSRAPVSRLLATGAVVIAAVLVARLAWMAAMSWMLRPLRSGDPPQRGESLILGWAGMRGAVTLAAVFAVPTSNHHGALLAGRDDVIYLAFGVIFATLIGQGLTLRLVARALRAGEDGSATETEREARVELLHAALDHLEQETQSGDLPDEVATPLRAQLEARLRRIRGVMDDPETHEWVVAKELALRRELLAVERHRLAELRAQGRLSNQAVRDIERDLDLDEARLR